MESHQSALSLLINIHKRLSQDSLITPYKLWCDRVHSLNITPEEKWSYLLSWNIIPDDYDNPRIFRSDWQLFKLLSKLSLGGRPSANDIVRARQKFLDAELRCKSVNTMLRSGPRSRGLSALLLSAQKIVASCLGDLSDCLSQFDVSDTSDNPRYIDKSMIDRFGRYSEVYDKTEMPKFGPGLSVGSGTDRLSSVSEKLLLGTVTDHLKWCLPWASHNYHIDNVSVVRGSRLTFVPKRVGEARAICYEPSMNMLVQKQVGSFLKKRLKASLGINLSDQSRNRSTARLGSLCDSWCTIDMSSASDLFATQLVMELLPFDWFLFLDSLRSHEYYDSTLKKWVFFEKFSTMGNGFTFEIETLLFAALTRAAISTFTNDNVSKNDIIVYGDDIVIPKQYYHVVCQSLTIVGHIPNLEKSFSHGHFRESCGGDFFKGWNVTPFKIKEINLERPITIVNIYNGLFASSRENNNFTYFSWRYSRCLAFIKAWLVSRYPRLSEGPVELLYDSTCLEFRAIPSNRWIWSERPSGLIWSKPLQALVPKYILSEARTPMSRFVPSDKKRVRMYYDVDPKVAGYFATHGYTPNSIWSIKTTFKPFDVCYQH